MSPEQLDAVRTYARLSLSITDMDRARYIKAVKAYAMDQAGDKETDLMLAERTARYLWDSRR